MSPGTLTGRVVNHYKCQIWNVAQNVYTSEKKSAKATAGTKIRTVAKVTVKICGNLVIMEDLFNVRTATANKYFIIF